MAYDPVALSIWILGGNHGRRQFSDLWRFDGVSWIPEFAPSFTSRTGGVLSFDETENHTILFGGVKRNYISDTWALSLGSAPFDGNADCVVDLQDLALFQQCVGMALPHDTCSSFDGDGDAIVTVDDVRGFAKLMSGPTGYPTP